uniref:Uncharacterized protein n=1 Tax=Anguilla anguilla TaxID=7936 RepID=A0A0E9TPX0_ANGAN
MTEKCNYPTMQQQCRAAQPETMLFCFFSSPQCEILVSLSKIFSVINGR